MYVISAMKTAFGQVVLYQLDTFKDYTRMYMQIQQLVLL